MSKFYSSSLKIGFWNIDGLKPKHFDKSQDSNFKKFVLDNEICAIGETHFSDNQSVIFEGYTSYYVNRKK